VILIWSAQFRFGIKGFNSHFFHQAANSFTVYAKSQVLAVQFRSYTPCSVVRRTRVYLIYQAKELSLFRIYFTRPVVDIAAI
jgi:hypothetical protein